jgi:hypothetical protein
MALKLLNPGLRPLGQFDLDDGAAALVGGEYVELQVDNVAAVEGYAADVGALVGADGGIVNFTPASRTAARFGGLADEGGAEYGTLFGDIIGGNAGRMTQFGTAGGSVVVGPDTDTASGKVTVWAQEGLYGVTADAGGAAGGGATTELAAVIAVNTPIQASNGDGGGVDRLGGLITTVENARVGIYVSAVSDTSLVSTTARAVGDAAINEYHAIFYVGNASA